MRNKAVHRTILIVDIEKFSSAERDDDIRARLRRELNEILDAALAAAGLDPGRALRSSTGDGALLLIDAEHKSDVLEAVLAIERRVRRYNMLASERARLRLRVALHAGEVIPDADGATGDDMILAFRLVDSDVLRERLAAAPRSSLALIVSEFIYRHVVVPGHSDSFRAGDFDQVTVRNKELVATAWAHPPARPPATRARPAPARPPAAAAGGWQPRPPPRRPGARAALWALLAATSVALPSTLPPPVAATAVCPIPWELPVLTTPAKAPVLHQLAVEFSDRFLAGDGCRQASVTVFAAPSASAAARALVAGWPGDDLTIGPRPAVWWPDTTAEVDRVNRLLGRDELVPLGVVATSPVVLAVPRSAMAAIGQERVVPWREVLGWVRPAPGGPGLHLARADPTSSAAGLLATVELYGTVRETATADAERHGIEQRLDTVSDELAGLCALRELGEGGGPEPRAVILPEQVMVAYNRGQDFGGPCPARVPEEPDRLEAVYFADSTPTLDHPLVLLPAARELPAREALARALFQYLTGDQGRRRLLEAGFRDQAGRVGRAVGEAEGVLPHEPRQRQPTLDGEALAAAVQAWERARLRAAALLAVDVSGSMSEEFPGPGGRRISAARDAAARAVRLMGREDAIGLWRFSQRLAGSRDYEVLVPLGRAGEPVGGVARRDRVLAALGRLEATPRDTGLYDTISAGVARLRAAGGRDAVSALVVVTDGQDDDPSGGANLAAVLDQLDAGEPVLVFLLTFGSVDCGAGELGVLAGHPAVRCFDAGRMGLEQAFRQVAAELWGTGAQERGGEART